MKKKTFLITGVILAICCCIALQHSIVKNYGYTMSEESVTYLPSNPAIKPFLLGYETTFANYLWIRTILYFGHHYTGDNNFKWLDNMVDIISKLNPYFYPVYEFSGLMLTDMTGNVDLARIMMERGIFYVGDKKWNPAFYLGMIYFKYYHDDVTAAKFFTIAINAKNAPVQKLLKLAKAFLLKTDNKEDSLAMTAFLYQTCENPEVKKYLAESFQKMYDQDTLKTKSGYPQ
jgi:hypothetical protein